MATFKLERPIPPVIINLVLRPALLSTRHRRHDRSTSNIVLGRNLILSLSDIIQAIGFLLFHIISTRLRLLTDLLALRGPLKGGFHYHLVSSSIVPSPNWFSILNLRDLSAV
jgi:hypothetical protein